MNTATIVSTDPTLVVRRARKAWRCICADEIKHVEFWRHCEHGSTGGRVRTVEEAEARVEARRGTLCHGGKTPKDERFEITPVPNPSYRSDCLGDIAPGETYVEYLGEAAFYEHGTSYCVKCAVAVWDEVTAQ